MSSFKNFYKNNVSDYKIYEVKSYIYGDYIVDVSANYMDDSYVDFYLHHKDYGVKSLMFGLKVDFNDDHELKQYIIENIDEQIKFYKEKYEI